MSAASLGNKMEREISRSYKNKGSKSAMIANTKHGERSAGGVDIGARQARYK